VAATKEVTEEVIKAIDLICKLHFWELSTTITLLSVELRETRVFTDDHRSRKRANNGRNRYEVLGCVTNQYKSINVVVVHAS